MPKKYMKIFNVNWTAYLKPCVQTKLKIKIENSNKFVNQKFYNLGKKK